MPSKSTSKSSAKRPPARRPTAAKPAKKPAAKPAGKPAPKVAPKKAPTRPAAKAKVAEPEPELPVPEPRRIDGRRHLLSLSFVRDGDEFLARMETDTGHITELKNRALDQLLTLVAGELEDLLD